MKNESTKVYVGNLSRFVNEYDLIQTFSLYGNIVEDIVKGKYFAIIVKYLLIVKKYHKSSEANLAIEKMNNQNFMGTIIKVQPYPKQTFTDLQNPDLFTTNTYTNALCEQNFNSHFLKFPLKNLQTEEKNINIINEVINLSESSSEAESLIILEHSLSKDSFTDTMLVHTGLINENVSFDLDKENKKQNLLSDCEDSSSGTSHTINSANASFSDMSFGPCH